MSERFFPPRFNPIVHGLFVPLNHYILLKDTKRIVDEGSLARWKSIPPDAACFIAMKHSDFSDHLSMGDLAFTLGKRLLYVSVPEAFKQNFGLTGFVIRRLGAFPVERGGRNVLATRFIVDRLVDGKVPLLIFPEGELHFLNDVVTPLKAGTALFALEGAKARRQAGKPDSMVVLPVGAKYVYHDDITKLLEERISRNEQKFFGSVKPGHILERIFSLMDDVLRRYASEFSIPLNEKTIEENYFFLSGQLIERLEREEYGKNFEGGLSDRARRLMTHLEGNKKKFEMARLALHALDFFPGYLGELSQERLMETVRKLERIITGNENPPSAGKRLLFMRMEEPILVDTYLDRYLERKTKREAIHQLTADLQTSIERSVASLVKKTGSFSKSQKPAGVSS